MTREQLKALLHRWNDGTHDVSILAALGNRLHESLDLVRRPDVDPADAFLDAINHLAPFFAQGVHSGTVATKGHVAENHGTDEVVVAYPSPVCSSGDGWICAYSGIPRYPNDGPVFSNRDTSRNKWGAELDAKLDPEAVYDMELRLRRRS